MVLGLLGYRPDNLDVDEADRRIVELRNGRTLTPPGLPALAFDPEADVVFDFGPALPGHANGLVFEALDGEGTVLLSETFYSIGGGFVVTAAEREAVPTASREGCADWPYPFECASTMLRMARETSLGGLAVNLPEC